MTYNDKNQLVAMDLADSDEGESETYKFEYDEKGRINIYTTQSASGAEANKYTFKYDEQKGTVKMFINGDEDHLYVLNKDGLIQTNKEQSEKEYETYDYDKANNLIKYYEYDGTQLPRKVEELCEYTYNTEFSIYKDLNLAPWFYSNHMDLPTESGITGINCPKVMDEKYITTIVKEGEDDNVNLIREVSTWTVIEEKNNYPTEIKEVFSNNQNNDRDMVVWSESIITITYKEIK